MSFTHLPTSRRGVLGLRGPEKPDKVGSTKSPPGPGPTKVAGLAADVGYHRRYTFDKAARALPMGPDALGSHSCGALPSSGEGSIGEELVGGQEKSEKNLLSRGMLRWVSYDWTTRGLRGGKQGSTPQQHRKNHVTTSKQRRADGAMSGLTAPARQGHAGHRGAWAEGPARCAVKGLSQAQLTQGTRSRS